MYLGASFEQFLFLIKFVSISLLYKFLYSAASLGLLSSTFWFLNLK